MQRNTLRITQISEQRIIKPIKPNVRGRNLLQTNSRDLHQIPPPIPLIPNPPNSPNHLQIIKTRHHRRRINPKIRTHSKLTHSTVVSQRLQNAVVPYPKIQPSQILLGEPERHLPKLHQQTADVLSHRARHKRRFRPTHR